MAPKKGDVPRPQLMPGPFGFTRGVPGTSLRPYHARCDFWESYCRMESNESTEVLIAVSLTLRSSGKVIVPSAVNPADSPCNEDLTRRASEGARPISASTSSSDRAEVLTPNKEFVFCEFSVLRLRHTRSFSGSNLFFSSA